MSQVPYRLRYAARLSGLSDPSVDFRGEPSSKTTAIIYLKLALAKQLVFHGDMSTTLAFSIANSSYRGGTWR